MAAQEFINIVQDKDKKQELLTLIEQQLYVDNLIATYLQDIKDGYIKLGLKPAEFKTACKYYQNNELLFNELASLEQIAELLTE